ncbi:MAG: PqqD family protein [Opitutaceae bacterium]
MVDVLELLLAVRPTLVSKRMAQGAVLVDSETGDCFELNRIGADIWSELERGVSAVGIADALAIRHHISCETAVKDVRNLVEDLVRRGLLKVLNDR